MNTASMFVTAFLLINAVFWGLGSHRTHCSVAAAMGVSNCPPHWVHLILGAASFVGAIAVSQWKYLKSF